jgi:hypothetical protein
MGEDELKFTDYYLGTDRHKIVRVETLDAAFKVSPMALPTFDIAAMLATFPSFDDLAAHRVLEPLRPIVLGRCSSFAAVLPASIRLVDGWSPPETHGVWSDGERAVLELFIGENMAHDVIVELKFTGYVPTKGLRQRVTVRDEVKLLESFEIADATPVDLRFPIGEAALTDGLLRLTFVITTAVSPQSLGLGPDTRKLGIALSTLQLMPPSVQRTPLDATPHLSVGERY